MNKSTQPEITMNTTNCPRCGAIIDISKRNTQCDYCNTSFTTNDVSTIQKVEQTTPCENREKTQLALYGFYRRIAICSCIAIFCLSLLLIGFASQARQAKRQALDAERHISQLYLELEYYENVGLDDTQEELDEELFIDTYDMDFVAMVDLNYGLTFRPNSAEFVCFETASLMLRVTAGLLKSNSEIEVLVYGGVAQTNSPLSTESALQLSQERAQTVVDILIDFGVNPAQLTALGTGWENPRFDSSQPAHSTNRFVAIVCRGGNEAEEVLRQHAG